MAEKEKMAYKPVRAPRGNSLHCRGWSQEAARRMLMNNLDPEVAEKPQELIVYGGTGKAARNWDCFRAIVSSLKNSRTMKLCSFSRANRWVSLKPTAKPRES